MKSISCLDPVMYVNVKVTEKSFIVTQIPLPSVIILPILLYYDLLSLPFVQVFFDVFSLRI